MIKKIDWKIFFLSFAMIFLPSLLIEDFNTKDALFFSSVIGVPLGLFVAKKRN